MLQSELFSSAPTLGSRWSVRGTRGAARVYELTGFDDGDCLMTLVSDSHDPPLEPFTMRVEPDWFEVRGKMGAATLGSVRRAQ